MNPGVSLLSPLRLGALAAVVSLDVGVAEPPVAAQIDACLSTRCAVEFGEVQLRIQESTAKMRVGLGNRRPLPTHQRWLRDSRREYDSTIDPGNACRDSHLESRAREESHTMVPRSCNRLKEMTECLCNYLGHWSGVTPLVHHCIKKVAQVRREIGSQRCGSWTTISQQ